MRWGGCDGGDEVLTDELELELVVKPANDLDLFLFTFCRNFGSFDDECEVDSVEEEFDESGGTCWIRSGSESREAA